MERKYIPIVSLTVVQLVLGYLISDFQSSSKVTSLSLNLGLFTQSTVSRTDSQSSPIFPFILICSIAILLLLDHPKVAALVVIQELLVIAGIITTIYLSTKTRLLAYVWLAASQGPNYAEGQLSPLVPTLPLVLLFSVQGLMILVLLLTRTDVTPRPEKYTFLVTVPTFSAIGMWNLPVKFSNLTGMAPPPPIWLPQDTFLSLLFIFLVGFSLMDKWGVLPVVLSILLYTFLPSQFSLVQLFSAALVFGGIFLAGTFLSMWSSSHALGLRRHRVTRNISTGILVCSLLLSSSVNLIYMAELLSEQPVSVQIGYTCESDVLSTSTVNITLYSNNIADEDLPISFTFSSIYQLDVLTNGSLLRVNIFNASSVSLGSKNLTGEEGFYTLEFVSHVSFMVSVNSSLSATSIYAVADSAGMGCNPMS